MLKRSKQGREHRLRLVAEPLPRKPSLRERLGSQVMRRVGIARAPEWLVAMFPNEQRIPA